MGLFGTHLPTKTVDGMHLRPIYKTNLFKKVRLDHITNDVPYLK